MQANEENLIGYLLGALSPEEQSELEAQIQEQPELQRKLEVLRRGLLPLENDRASQTGPPAHLASRTIEAVLQPAGSTLPMAPTSDSSSPSTGGRWRRADVVAASIAFLVLAGVGAVWLMQGWHRSEIAQCQDNMRQVHGALVSYAETRNDGSIPRPDAEGALAFAGVMIPVLKENGYLKGIDVCCPVHRTNAPPSLTCEQLKLWHREDPMRYQRAIRELGGFYAYPLGYSENGELRSLRVGVGDDGLPVMADAPSFPTRLLTSPDNSRNHQGKGQNVLFLGGHVRFFTARTVGFGGDDIYVNQHNKVQAGVHSRDTVLGSSEVPPMSRRD